MTGFNLFISTILICIKYHNGFQYAGCVATASLPRINAYFYLALRMFKVFEKYKKCLQ